MKTKVTSQKEIVKNWHLIDAKGQVLGRLATQVSELVLGKHKPYFTPNLDCGDKVVVINAKEIVVTGKKLTDKIYHHHSNYPGGLKSEVLGDLLSRRPEEAIHRAVYNMLPKNKLRDVRMNNLYIYAGATHPHRGQLGNLS